MRGSLMHHLSALQRGEELVLRRRRNQYGDEVTTQTLSFKGGKWMLWEVWCGSSLDWGFGTCHCISHPSAGSRQISRGEALVYLQEHLEKETSDEKARETEIAWLAEQIRQLS